MTPAATAPTDADARLRLTAPSDLWSAAARAVTPTPPAAAGLVLILLRPDRTAAAGSPHDAARRGVAQPPQAGDTARRLGPPPGPDAATSALGQVAVAVPARPAPARSSWQGCA
jgi:hypothetical protein